MFSIVTVVRVHILYSDRGTFTCSVLWHLYGYMFCIVTVVSVHVLYCDSDTCTCSVLWQWYVYMFCVVTMVGVHVLYCDSDTCTCSVLWEWYARRNFGIHCASQPQLVFLFNYPNVMRKLKNHAAHHVFCNIKTHKLQFLQHCVLIDFRTDGSTLNVVRETSKKFVCVRTIWNSRFMWKINSIWIIIYNFTCSFFCTSCEI